MDIFYLFLGYDLISEMHHRDVRTIPKRQILDSSKMEVFADDNLKLNENCKIILQTGRKHCEKRRNCSLRVISPFHTEFSNDFTADA